MKFNEFLPIYAIMRRAGVATGTADQFYAEAFDQANGDPTASNQMTAESFWLEDHAPYYCVWPSIIPMLCKLRLNIDAGLIKPPMRALLVRLPEEKNPLAWKHEGRQHEIQTILLTEANVSGSDGLTAWMDIGERAEMPDGSLMPVYTYRNIRTTAGRTVEMDLDELADALSLGVGLRIPRDTEIECLRLVCTLCLIAKDPELITADVLNKDRGKYADTLDPKYVAKAIRRGKHGWHVGAGLEVIPHVRRPHPALQWYGPGRTQCKIIMRKGSIVHREKMVRMPTGHDTAES
jgi:hypothetical protein